MGNHENTDHDDQLAETIDDSDRSLVDRPAPIHMWEAHFNSFCRHSVTIFEKFIEMDADLVVLRVNCREMNPGIRATPKHKTMERTVLQTKP